MLPDLDRAAAAVEPDDVRRAVSVGRVAAPGGGALHRGGDRTGPECLDPLPKFRSLDPIPGEDRNRETEPSSDRGHVVDVHPVDRGEDTQPGGGTYPPERIGSAETVRV